MAAATDKFSELETRILRTIELLKTTRQEKEKAERELSAARAQMSRLEQEVDELRRERDVVRDKVESLLESLSEITEGSIV
jgi:chromosome segregation ATPase